MPPGGRGWKGMTSFSRQIASLAGLLESRVGIFRTKPWEVAREYIRECSRPLQPYTEHFTEFARIVYAHNKWAWLEAPTQQFSAQLLSRFSWQLTRYEPQSKAKGITHWIENRVARKS